MFLKKLLFLFVSLSLIISTGCDPGDPEPEDPVEVITTFTYTLTPADGFPIFLRFKDVDGDGSESTQVQGGPFKANTEYSGVIELANESGSTAMDITEEVLEEAAEHQLFFQTSMLSGINVSYKDEDENGNPLGLQTTLTTGDAGSGELTITLRHEPEKTATGVAEGKIENAGGETDIELTFDIVVE